MLTLTQAAGDHLQQLMTSSSAPEGTSIRFVQEGGRLKMALDEERPQDTVITHNDQALIVLDPQVASQLDEKTLDVAQTAEGTQLVLS